MRTTIQNYKVYSFTNYVVSSYYPLLNKIVNFSFADRKSINKDEFMVGIWKIKNLKK